MVLETPFLVADPAKWNDQPVSARDYLGGYICEGVSITNVAMRAKPQANDSLRVVLHNVLINRRGHDKFVTLMLEVLVDGKPIAPAVTLRDLDLEEKKSLTKDAMILLPKASLPKDSLPVLRITVAVRDN